MGGIVDTVGDALGLDMAGTPAQAIQKGPYTINTGLFGGSFDPSNGGLISGQIESGILGSLQQRQLARAQGIGSWMLSGGNRNIQTGDQFLRGLNPYDLKSAAQQLIRGGRFDQDPRGEYGKTALGLSQDVLGQLGSFDPMTAAEEQFNKLDAILEPGRTRARTGTSAGLLASGRLGSTAGARTQGEVESRIEQERQALLADQFGKATGVQQQLADLAGGLGGFGSSLMTQDTADSLAKMQAGGALLGQQVDIGETLQRLGLGTKQVYQDISQKELAGALGINSALLSTLQGGSAISSPAGVAQATPGVLETAIGGFAGGLGGAAGKFAFGG